MRVAVAYEMQSFLEIVVDFGLFSLPVWNVRMSPPLVRRTRSSGLNDHDFRPVEHREELSSRFPGPPGKLTVPENVFHDIVAEYQGLPGVSNGKTDHAAADFLQSAQ
jgi:hypothetical protein